MQKFSTIMILMEEVVMFLFLDTEEPEKKMTQY